MRYKYPKKDQSNTVRYPALKESRSVETSSFPRLIKISGRFQQNTYAVSNIEALGTDLLSILTAWLLALLPAWNANTNVVCLLRTKVKSPNWSYWIRDNFHKVNHFLHLFFLAAQSYQTSEIGHLRQLSYQGYLGVDGHWVIYNPRLFAFGRDSQRSFFSRTFAT